MKPFYEYREKDYEIWQSDDIRFVPHLHEHLEIIYMQKGKSDVRIDGTRYTIRAGEFFLTFPNQIHSYDNTQGNEAIILIVRPQLLPAYAALFRSRIPESPVLRPAGKDGALLTFLIARMLEEGSALPEEDRNGYLSLFFAKFLKAFRYTDRAENTSSAAQDIIQYCRAHYRETLSLSALSRALHLSESCISHVFSKRLGMRFCDYVNDLRLNEACRRLRDSDETVTAIAEAVGFSSIRTFNRAFQKYTGTVPRDYRRSFRQSVIPHP